MKFNYKAVNKAGESYSGSKEAENEAALFAAVKAEGGMLVESSEEGKGSGFGGFDFKKLLFKGGKVKLRDKIIFSRNIAAMLQAGLALSRALSVAGRQTKHRTFAEAIADVNVRIRGGSSFAEALAAWPKIFPSIFVSMVKAGEESGGLVQALLVLADQMDKSYHLQKRIKGAMVYPAIVMSLMLIVGILLMVFVVPTLTSTFKELNVELPAATRFIVGISDALNNYGIFLLIGAVILGVLGRMVWKMPKAKRTWQRAILSIPMIGEMVKQVNAAYTSRTLASLLSGGVEFTAAIDITRDVIQNVHYKEVLDEARQVVQKGGPISGVFAAHTNLYPVLVSEMASVGEETGGIAKMFGELAIFYENEVDQKTKDMSTIIEPFLMVIIGASVGFFAVAMISPTYSLLDNL